MQTTTIYTNRSLGDHKNDYLTTSLRYSTKQDIVVTLVFFSSSFDGYCYRGLLGKVFNSFLVVSTVILRSCSETRNCIFSIPFFKNYNTRPYPRGRRFQHTALGEKQQLIDALLISFRSCQRHQREKNAAIGHNEVLFTLLLGVLYTLLLGSNGACDANYGCPPFWK